MLSTSIHVTESSNFRLIKNKFFGSVFNMTTTAMFIITGRLGEIMSKV